MRICLHISWCWQSKCESCDHVFFSVILWITMSCSLLFFGSSSNHNSQETNQQSKKSQQQVFRISDISFDSTVLVHIIHAFLNNSFCASIFPISLSIPKSRIQVVLKSVDLDFRLQSISHILTVLVIIGWIFATF